MKQVHIYILSDPRTKDIRYVGKSENAMERWRKHLMDKSNLHKFNWVTSLKKLGLSPVLEIVEIIDESEWMESEIFWIGYFRFLGFRLTNIANGGTGPGATSVETRRRQSEFRKNHPMFSGRMTQMNLARRGHKLSEEHKAKISMASKSRRASPETRAKMSASMKGIPKSPIARARMSAAKKGNPGRPQSVEERCKRSATLIKHYQSKKEPLTPETARKMVANKNKN